MISVPYSTLVSDTLMIPAIIDSTVDEARATK